MTGDRMNADVEQYLQAAAMNTPPPQIISDALVTGITPVEQLLRVLGLAANLGDPEDNAESAEEHARREAALNEAAQRFAEQDAQAAAELADIAEYPDYVAVSAELGQPPSVDQTAAMTQQLPQAVSSIAGALAGAIGGALQPLTQIPQQLAQGAQQAMQTGMGVLQQASAPTADTSQFPDDFTDSPDDFANFGDFGDAGMGGGAAPGGDGAGAPGGTTPTAMLGPAPVPPASTAPSSAPMGRIVTPSAAPTPHLGGAGMAGMPMIPPGAMAGNTGADKDSKPETRRVSVPPVRNGAPVQGRLTAPPPPVVKNIDGTPVVTRRPAAANTKRDASPSSEQ